MLAVGVLIMVVIDLLVLTVFTGVVSGLNLSLVQVVPHRENRQTVTGVRVKVRWPWRSRVTPVAVMYHSSILSSYRRHVTAVRNANIRTVQSPYRRHSRVHMLITRPCTSPSYGVWLLTLIATLPRPVGYDTRIA